MNESGLIPLCEKFIKDHPDELLVLEVFELLHLFNNKRLRELKFGFGFDENNKSEFVILNKEKTQMKVIAMLFEDEYCFLNFKMERGIYTIKYSDSESVFCLLDSPDITKSRSIEIRMGLSKKRYINVEYITVDMKKRAIYQSI